MKNIIYFVFLLFTINAFSQHEIIINIVERPSSMGLAPAFETTIPAVDLKMADELFEKVISSERFFGLIRKRTANIKEGHERITEEFVLESVSRSPMMVLFQVTDFSSQTYLRFFFKLDEGFLGAPGVGSKSEIANAEKFVHGYAVKLYAQTLSEKISEEEDVYSKLKKKYNKLERRKKRIEKRYFTGQPKMSRDKSGGDLIDVEQAVSNQEKFQKGQKKGQRKIRGIRKEQTKWEAQMRNQQRVIDKLEDELDAIE